MHYVSTYHALADYLVAKLGARALVLPFADLVRNPAAAVAKIEAVSGLAFNFDGPPQLAEGIPIESPFRRQFQQLVERSAQ